MCLQGTQKKESSLARVTYRVYNECERGEKGGGRGEPPLRFVNKPVSLGCATSVAPGQSSVLFLVPHSNQQTVLK